MEVKWMFLKKSDSKKNLKVETIKIVRVEVDEEGGVGVVKALFRCVDDEGCKGRLWYL